jgi:hypothetical protein
MSAHGTATQHDLAEINAFESSLPPVNGPRVTLLSPRHSGRVTRVTRDSSDSLRARARRASDESYVTNVLSMLTSDVGTSIQTYQFHCAYAYAVGLSKSHVTSVTGLESTPK